MFSRPRGTKKADGRSKLNQYSFQVSWMSFVTECIDMLNHSWKELSELDTSLGVDSAKALPILSFFWIWKLDIFPYHGDRIFQIRFPHFRYSRPSM